MATVVFLSRQRLLACSLRLFGGAHSRCLSTMSETSPTSLASDSWPLANRRNLLLPTVNIRFNHKSANPAAAAPAPAINNSSAGGKDLKATNSTTSSELFGEAANMGLFAKFKHMYKQYWYVLIPVHVLTSVGWFGGFYYLSKRCVPYPRNRSVQTLYESLPLQWRRCARFAAVHPLEREHH